MLKFQSFKLSDSDGINKFLKSNILAKGSTVFHSQGEILLPYEDGTLPNAEQRILMMKELQNEQSNQLDLLIHSQRVLEFTSDGVQREIDKLNSELVTAPKGKEQVTANQEKTKEIKRLEGVKDQTEKTIFNNQAEVTRLVMNIKMFDQRISECK